MSTKAVRAKRAAFIVAAYALLASCGAAEPGTREGKQATRFANSVKSAAPSRPAADMPATPVLTAHGLGELKIGMTLAEVIAAAGPDANPAATGGHEPEQCDQFRPSRAPQGVLVMVEDGRLTRISLIRSSTIKTDRGVGLGSSAAEVRIAYKSAAIASPHKYRDAPAEYLTVWARKSQAGNQTTATDRGIVFEVDGRGVVDLVHAGGPSIQYIEGCL